MVFTGAGGLTVGGWVEVMHDFSPGHNSGGGVGVIIEIIEQLSHVRYIVDSHVEKFVALTRLTTIPMPYRREKAKLRTRSAQVEPPKKGRCNWTNDKYMNNNLYLPMTGSSVSDRTSLWSSMNDIELLQYGLDEGLHKKRAGFGDAWLMKVWWNIAKKRNVCEYY